MTIDGRQALPGEPPSQVTRVAVGSRYFDTLGLTLTRGRTFADTGSGAGHQVAIVNQRLASMYFAGEDPLGRRIRLVPDSTGGEPPWMTIIGVSPTIRQRRLREPDPDPVVYVPYRLAPEPAMVLMVRTAGEPSAMTSTLREEVRALDPDLPLFGIATMDEILAQRRWFDRVFGTMFAAFATVALMLSAVGLYAMTAYAVTRRTQEIGVRMALGAEARQVWRLFIGPLLCWDLHCLSSAQLAVGLTLGMAGAFGVGRLLRSLRAQTSATDPLTLITTAIVFASVSLTACYVAARRATAIDPLRALRSE